MEGRPFVSEKERWLGRMAAERLKASGCDRPPAVLLAPKAFGISRLQTGAVDTVQIL